MQRRTIPFTMRRNKRARSDYQYVNPGELRFEIVNPGALYDEDTAQTGAVQGATEP